MANSASPAFQLTQVQEENGLETGIRWRQEACTFARATLLPLALSGDAFTEQIQIGGVAQALWQRPPGSGLQSPAQPGGKNPLHQVQLSGATQDSLAGPCPLKGANPLYRPGFAYGGGIQFPQAWLPGVWVILPSCAHPGVGGRLDLQPRVVGLQNPIFPTRKQQSS